MNNMDSKQIKINPNFFKIDKDKRRTPKQHSSDITSVKSMDVKKKLIGKIKNYQSNQHKKNELTPPNTPEILTTDFNTHLSQLENIINKKKDKKRRKQTKRYKAQLRQHNNQVSSIRPTTQQGLEISHNKKEEPAYGCLKNGSKPTWSQYKKTLKKTEPIIKEKISFIDPPNIEITADMKTRQNKFELLKQTLATPSPPKDPIKKLINCKRTLKVYKLGKNKKSLTVGVLIKSCKTRKNVCDERNILKSRCLSEVKQYLRKHNLIRAGTNAPENVLRQIYEDSFLAGNIYNKNPENLLHNYINSDESNVLNE